MLLWTLTAPPEEVANGVLRLDEKVPSPPRKALKIIEESSSIEKSPAVPVDIKISVMIILLPETAATADAAVLISAPCLVT